MVISVDHGNSSIKTAHRVFTSGLVVADTKPGFQNDYIFWAGKYYMLTERRISYMRDKTEDERFFVLTLFAIAYELERAGVMEADDPVDITLLIGLPPAHYGQLHAKFERYCFRNREIIDFEFNDRCYSVRMTRVISYTQALAAAVTRFADLKNYAVSYIIDIGGFTVDVLKLRNGRPDIQVMESFEQGVITLHNSIISQCNAQYGRLLEECDVDEVITSQPTVLPGEIQLLIRRMTTDFLSEFFNFLREHGIDVSSSKCVFAGGGAILLRTMIERGGRVGFPVFIDDIHANAVGYNLLYQSEVAAHAKR